ncbi:hypothetical protein L3Q82_020961 [Scortum barcoo]|uniref:Uncharacterized protein n=1 Tax=Scortum barcoo TaxID=214431 RepID=A0ACB8V9G1_9TELE|nr:hypothetical protein L3Q82_020961 [Scortum barcoo]
MPPGRLPPREVFQACPTGRRPRGRPRTHIGETISLGWPGNASGPPGRAGGSVWGEGSLGISAQTAASATRSRIKRLTAAAAGRKDLRYLSFTQRGWSSRSLKELPRAVRVSCRGWDVLFNRDDSLAIILPFPTTSTESRGHPRTELALLTSLSILLLSLSVMLLAQQTIPKKMADATTES